jgi:hypothetical protein
MTGVKPPRVTIRRLAIWVAVVGLNLGLGRALYAHGENLLYALAPMGLALQVAAYRLIHLRGQARAFWVGFLTGGLTAVASLVWAVLRPGGAVGLAWRLYAHSASGLTAPLPWSGYPWVAVVRVACNYGLPQFLAALIGGLIARWWVRWACPQSASSATMSP